MQVNNVAGLELTYLSESVTVIAISMYNWCPIKLISAERFQQCHTSMLLLTTVILFFPSNTDTENLLGWGCERVGRVEVLH